MSRIFTASEGKVWSLHTYSEAYNALQKYRHLKFSKWPQAAILELIARK